MYKKRVINDSNVRIDRYIRQELLPNIKQSVLEKYLRKGIILLDNKKVKSNARVFLNQEISITENILTTKENNTEKPNKKYPSEDLVHLIRNSIIYEDAHIVAINKPHGIAVQGGSKIKFSIDDVLDKIIPDEKLKIVHRLDKTTSGVLLFAKNKTISNDIMIAFKNHEIKKEYLALTHGIPFKNSGQITTNISDKPSITLFKILKKFNSDNIAFLKINPLTGRKHQIRIHLSEINCPIIGDRKYGNAYNSDMIKLQLHSHNISLKIANNSINVLAPIPQYMNELLEKSR